MVPQKASAQYPGISFQVFYDQLSPYGVWVDDANYGYIWIPDEGQGFYPYGTAGHWVFTVYGWTWVSDYPWGWAPFHYGRWNFDEYYGWIWVPGNEWGPAWVTWRSYNGYYGWAPLAPGITLQMSFNRGFYMPDDRWMFVRDRDFDREDLDRHFVGRRENHDLIRNARVIQNTRVDNSRNVTYITGPDAREIRKVTGRAIKPMPVKEDARPGRTIVEKGGVGIYRPPVTREEVKGQKPVPGKILAKDNIKPVAERTKGDLVKPNVNTEQRKGNDKIRTDQKTVPPKYERTDKVNQNNSINVTPGSKGNPGQNRQTGTNDVQKREVQPPKGNTQNENRNVNQNNKKIQQPPVETRSNQQSGKKQIGAPVQKSQPAKVQQQRTSPPKGKVVEQKQNTPPVKTEKEETPRKRN